MTARRLIVSGLVIGAAAIVAVAIAAPRLGSERGRQASTRSSTPARPRTVQLTIEANGDLLIHSPIFNLALQQGGGHTYNFSPMLRFVRPLIRRADVAVCHVETPMTSAKPTGYPLFNTPPALAGAIARAGWRACDTASNHTLDQGQQGVNSTISSLNRARVAHTGSWSSASARRTPLLLQAHGVRIAWLAYTEMTNGIPLPHPWTVGVANSRVILRDARAARRLGAQAVIVNLHWGNEYQHSPSTFQFALARRLTASPDITAVVGQHVHVVQPIRWINGKPVVFGEGNLLSNQTVACCPTSSQDGLMAFLHLSVTGPSAAVTSVDYVPIWVRHPDFAVLPVSAALRRHWAAASDLHASWARTTSVVGSGPRVRAR